MLSERSFILVFLKNEESIHVLGVLKKIESEGGLFFMSFGDADVFLDEGNEFPRLSGRISTLNGMLSMSATSLTFWF